MRTDGIFNIHTVEIPCKIGEPVKLIPFGDVHRESPQFADEHWRDFISTTKAYKNAVFLGMGDYADGCSTSERMILDSHGLHESTRATLDNVYKGVTKTLANELSYMRGRCIGLLGGNHFYGLQDGQTTDSMLAAALGTTYLGVCAMIRLVFKDRHGCTMNFDIFAHHGKGGGQLPGSTFNTLEKMQSGADADLYLMGHDHKKGIIPSSPRLRLVNDPKRGLIIKERTPWLGRTGSFLKSYEPGKVSYNVDACRTPASLGWIELEITMKREQTTAPDGKRTKTARLKIRGIS